MEYVSNPNLSINSLNNQILKYDPIELEFKGIEIRLTNFEFEILYFSGSHQRRVFTYQELYEAVWNEKYTYEKENIMSVIQKNGKTDSARLLSPTLYPKCPLC